MKSECIRVNAGAGYDIHIQKGILAEAGSLVKNIARGKTAAVVTDSTVAELYGEPLRSSLTEAGFHAPMFAFPAGEASKTHETLLSIYSFLARNDVTRTDTVVALGGGVPGDVAGFAAATWQRGVDFVQIPTTLLAQVDSSIGGKTAVDLKEGKNLVGAFWQPKLVLCDPDTLKTLPPSVFACGMAECIKHAFIRSRPLFGLLSTADPMENIERVVRENLLIKRDVVERDEKETGERMLLNFGHTLGHAMEKLTGYTGYTHGEAVAMGMSLITKRSEELGLTDRGTFEALRGLLQKAGLPTECPLPLPDLIEAAKGDKKRAGGSITLILVRKIGESFRYPVPVAELGHFFGL